MAPCSRPRSVLCHLLSLMLLLQLPPRGSTEQFMVNAPSKPIVAVLGEDVTLPCSLDPVMSAENMELRWFRSDFSETVLIYKDRQEWYEELMAQYSGRTSLVGEFLSEGQAAVRIHKVQACDSGLYTCFFSNGVFYEQASLELKVTGLGSAPQVHIMGPAENGVRVVCTASGWFPKPQVQWRDPRGEELLALSEVQAEDVEGLFGVEATLVVRDRSAGNVTCSILNPVLGQEKAVAMLIPEPFFPQASPWKPAFLVSLPLLLLLLLAAAYYTRREHSTHMQELCHQRDVRQAKEGDRQTKVEALKDRDTLQEMLDQRKADYLAAWRKAQLYADWRTEKFRAWSVTLDPGLLHSGIVLSHDRKSLAYNHDGVQNGFCAWGLEGITSGRCYWEVEVRSGNSSKWRLGVWRGNEKTKYSSVNTRNGYWTVGQKSTGFSAFTSPPTLLPLRQIPRRLGVFLDYFQGDISFYDMTDGSHIFSFPPASFSGTLFPFFRCFSGDMSLTICSLEAGAHRIPVPINIPPLREPVSPSGEGFHSASAVDVASPGLETPLLFPWTPDTLSPKAPPCPDMPGVSSRSFKFM